VSSGSNDRKTDRFEASSYRWVDQPMTLAWEVRRGFWDIQKMLLAAAAIARNHSAERLFVLGLRLAV